MDWRQQYDVFLDWVKGVYVYARTPRFDLGPDCYPDDFEGTVQYTTLNPEPVSHHPSRPTSHLQVRESIELLPKQTPFLQEDLFCKEGIAARLPMYDAPSYSNHVSKARTCMHVYTMATCPSAKHPHAPPRAASTPVPLHIKQPQPNPIQTQTHPPPKLNLIQYKPPPPPPMNGTYKILKTPPAAKQPQTPNPTSPK